ncbi:MAG: hypothetical protein IKS05_07375 [Oscillospiraceae bacterium]|nr:hypothetical protein [Oscillospiraceae bacterium]
MAEFERYCPKCGMPIGPGKSLCPAGHSAEAPKERPFADYVARKCKGDAEGKLYELIRDFLKAHLFGMLLTVSVIFTLVTALAAGGPRQTQVSDTPEQAQERYAARAWGEIGAATSPESTAAVTTTEPVALSAEDYYDFIATVLAPQYGMTAAGPLEYTSMTSDTRWIPAADALTEVGALGLFGADVADYDGDGSLDLMVGLLARGQSQDWVLGQSGWNTSDGAMLNLSLLFYSTDEAGEIQQIAALPAAVQIDESSYGQLGWYVRDWEGTRYVTGWNNLEDITTYGPRLNDTWHIDENGSFVHDYVGGALFWGQASYRGDLNADLGTENTQLPEYLVGRDLARLSISSPNRRVSTFSYEDLCHLGALLQEDRSEALKALAEDQESWQKENEAALQAWQEEQAMIEQYGKPMQSLARKISQASGITLEQVEDSFTDGVYSLTLKAPGGEVLELRSSQDPQKPGYLRLDSPDWKMTDDFAAIKDAILALEELGLDSSRVARYRGKQSGNYQNESLGGGVTITMMGVASYFLILNFEG